MVNSKVKVIMVKCTRVETDLRNKVNFPAFVWEEGEYCKSGKVPVFGLDDGQMAMFFPDE